MGQGFSILAFWPYVDCAATFASMDKCLEMEPFSAHTASPKKRARIAKNAVEIQVA
jgi:hypothetical protein